MSPARAIFPLGHLKRVVVVDPVSTKGPSIHQDPRRPNWNESPQSVAMGRQGSKLE